MPFSPAEIALILLGAVLGGFVNGLTGFGTALTAVPIWIHVMAPAPAAALGAAAGVVGQIRTMHLVWHSIEWRTVAPFIAAGLAGVPVGTWLLPSIDPRGFKLGVGAVLVGYCGFVLLAGRIAGRGLPAKLERAGDMLVGFGGGVMSGIAGLSGPLPIVWATFKPWSRDQKRALFQPFNMAILSATVVSSTLAGLLSSRFWAILLLALPGTLIGVALGSRLYRRLDDRRFDRVVLGLLMLMGASLVVANV